MKTAPSPQSLRYLRELLRSSPGSLPRRACHPFLRVACTRRNFHASRSVQRIETHTLSDIGEGVKEVGITQWFVEEGAQIEEWAPLCEVQSDKASVEITSKFSGVVKKLHFKRDDMVQVGEGMVDIEVEGDEEEIEQKEEEEEAKVYKDEDKEDVSGGEQAAEGGAVATQDEPPEPAPDQKQPTRKGEQQQGKPRADRGSHASLATPAVRGLLKEHNLDIDDVEGTGKDGRVLKEDVHKHLEAPATSATTPQVQPRSPSTSQSETLQRLTPIQAAMFKSMTASLSIPHFLYTDTIDMTALSALRRTLNTKPPPNQPKLSFLPFIVKATSLALNQYPLLNARLDTITDPSRPQLVTRSQHNIGVAMDTPSGLLVPVLKSVNNLSITQIASELVRLSQLGAAGKFSNTDLSGGTISVSNVGSIGGEVVAPVIVEGQLAISGIGKIKTVPRFNESGGIDRVEEMKMSWSADHRVVDGATMARMAEVVRKYLEQPGRMLTDMV